MLASKANWNIVKDYNDSLPETIKELDISSITKELLVQQGIKSNEAASKFISPKLDYLYATKKLSMIDKASERVHKAINNQEKILIYGDYDADGVCSTTLLLKALTELGANCSFYIPNRFTEGYGPNENAFRQAYESGFRLIITVDTGIASFHEAAVAKKIGLDLIITDHHEIQEKLPDAFAIINPKCSETYPFHELAGVGVAFKFAEHLLGYFPEHLLDLVAVGTIADLVPLIDENRILATFGLRELTATKNPGFKALKKVCNIEGNVTEEEVGFLIGPRINAVGRLQDANLAVDLLMTDNDEEAEQIAEEIQLINEQRQQLVNKIVVEAEQMIKYDPQEKNVIIVAKEGWNEGVLGIVASQLVRKYNRPAIALSINHETSVMKGSARSIPAFNLFKNCMKIRDLFTRFGGHSQAAGMTFPLESLDQIQEKLNEFISEQLSLEDFKQLIHVNKKLSLTEINETLINEINLLAPFGMKNPKPVFAIEEIPFDVRQIGHMKKHLKLQFEEKSTLLEGIGFNLGELYKYITPHTPLSIVGELGINEWNGNRKLQIVMQDMKINEWQLFDHRGRKNFSIEPYIKNNQRHIVISTKEYENLNHLNDYVKQFTYDMDISLLDKADDLYIFDLPKEKSLLEEIVRVTKPNNIHACYYVEASTYLTSFTSREAFKWFYGLILKRKKLDLKKELNQILHVKKWTQERVVFMTKVFQELNFVKVNHGVVEVNPQSEKRDLKESKLFEEQLSKADIEKKLYYSNYEDLKQWFENCMTNSNIAEEEMTDGL